MTSVVKGTWVRAAQNEMIDLIVWRFYGRTAGLVEAVLEANPGLADLAPFLPLGQPVFLPDVPKQTQSKTVVQLWG